MNEARRRTAERLARARSAPRRRPIAVCARPVTGIGESPTAPAARSAGPAAGRVTGTRRRRAQPSANVTGGVRPNASPGGSTRSAATNRSRRSAVCARPAEKNVVSPSVSAAILWPSKPAPAFGRSIVFLVRIRARPSCSSLISTSPLSRNTPGRERRIEDAFASSNCGSAAFTRHRRLGETSPDRSTQFVQTPDLCGDRSQP